MDQHGTRAELADRIANVLFNPVRWKGYDMAVVDDRLDRIVAALREGRDVQEIRDLARADDVPQVRLREGYDVAQVDAFLDDVARIRIRPDEDHARAD